MLNGKYRGSDIGSGTDVWKFSEDFRAGKMTREEFGLAEDGNDALGWALHDDGYGIDDGLYGRGARHDPARRRGDSAPDSRRKVLAHLAGSRIVEMVGEDLKMSNILGARPLRMPSKSTRPSAVRPTASSTCWPSPGASASSCPWTISTASAASCRYWSI